MRRVTTPDIRPLPDILVVAGGQISDAACEHAVRDPLVVVSSTGRHVPTLRKAPKILEKPLDPSHSDCA